MNPETPVAQSAVGNSTVLAPIGDIDMSRASSIRKAVTNAMRDRPAKLVIDMSQVPYVDSSGIATLVEALQLSMKNKSRLILVGISPKVRSAFEITKLVGMFTIAASVEEAVNS